MKTETTYYCHSLEEVVRAARMDHQGWVTICYKHESFLLWPDTGKKLKVVGKIVEADAVPKKSSGNGKPKKKATKETLKEKVIGAVGRGSGTVAEICKATGAKNKQISNVLVGLVKDGSVRRTGFGQYAPAAKGQG